MIDRPKSDKDYKPEHAEMFDKAISNVRPEHVEAMKNAALAVQMKTLQMLLAVCEDAIKIAHQHHYQSQAEPYPGSVKKVLEQSLMAIEVGKKSGLLP